MTLVAPDVQRSLQIRFGHGISSIPVSGNAIFTAIVRPVVCGLSLRVLGPVELAKHVTLVAPGVQRSLQTRFGHGISSIPVSGNPICTAVERRVVWGMCERVPKLVELG